VFSKAILPIVGILPVVCALVAASSVRVAAEPATDIPAWLMAHVGDGEGQIAEPVLQRARALYARKVREGAVANPCYFAMDATRPNDPAGGRFYVVCESQHSFSAISAGHGAGRDLAGLADFGNGRRCARNFGNAMDSDLTTGGLYVTGEIRTSFKGYYRVSATQDAAFMRSFIPFVGEGDTANAREREIGGHPAVALKGVCLRKDPGSPYASAEGYVPFGKLVDYAGGRSNGCTSWSSADAAQLSAMVKNDPTTLYLYPEAKDIHAVARAVADHRSLAGEGLYWNASCLREIGSPTYWPKETLEPIIARYRMEHPAPPPRPTPLCTGR
jgi:hypothetical protein